MQTLKDLQEEIIANRLRRGWIESATNIDKTALGFLEETAEFLVALQAENKPGMIDALGDLAVFALGGLQILGVPATTPARNELPLLDGITSEDVIALPFLLTRAMGAFSVGLKRKNQVAAASGLFVLLGVCFTGLRLLGADPMTVLTEIVENNKTRTHNGNH